MQDAETLINLLSLNRLARYGKNTKDSLNLYLLNTELCEAFYCSMSYLEIILRNKIDNVFSKIKGNNWLDCYKTEINKNLKDKYINPNDKNKLISELNFGFWTSFFTKKHRDIWYIVKLQNLFEFYKGRLNISRISYELNLIRNWRNKIFHYGNILIVKDGMPGPEVMHNMIYKYIKMLSGKVVIRHIKNIDYFDKIHNKLKMLKKC